MRCNAYFETHWTHANIVNSEACDVEGVASDDVMMLAWLMDVTDGSDDGGDGDVVFVFLRTAAPNSR